MTTEEKPSGDLRGHVQLDGQNMSAPPANSRLEGIRTRLSQFPGLFPAVREKWRAHRVYLFALLIFAASRLVVVIGVNSGSLFPRRSGPAQWDYGSAWYDGLLRWDAGWYAAIVREGYRYSDDPSVQGSTVFYPLYPLITYAVKSLFGIDPFVALLLVANVAALVAVLLMTKFIKDELGKETALSSLAFFCFFPSSLFLSSGYTESLYLMFVLLSFILMAREKFTLAAIVAGLALGTRSTGIVLIPVILLEMARRSALPWPRLVPRMALCAALAASGLLVFMAYLGVKFGRPLAFATGQAAWQGGTFLHRFTAAVTLAPVQHTDWWNSGLFLCFLVITIWSFARLRFAVSLYGLGTLAVPYLTLGVTNSMSRFVLVCFPAFMCMGILCKGRPWLVGTLIGIFAAVLFVTSALFSQWHRVG